MTIERLYLQIHAWKLVDPDFSHANFLNKSYHEDVNINKKKQLLPWTHVATQTRAPIIIDGFS